VNWLQARAFGWGVLVNFTVVVCAYSLERWRDLVEAVASLQRQTVGQPEIVVVVDHNDLMLERVRTRLPAVTAVANRHRQGLSGARNSGVEAASGDVIAFLDDDAVADDNWLERLREGYEVRDVLGVGGAVIPRWAGGRKPRWFPAEFGWVVGCSYRGQPTRITAVRNLIGANMSYRRDVLAATGGFREGIGRVGRRPLGCEETELSIRALQRFPGGQVLYDPDALVEHRVAPSGPTRFRFCRAGWAPGCAPLCVATLPASAGPRRSSSGSA
jgi:GT2 family glycosyltransferase